MPEVAVTGLGAVAPNGTGKEEFWQAVKQGVSGIGPVTRFDASGYPCRVAGEVAINGGYIKRTPDPLEPGENLSFSSKLILAASQQALDDAGIARESFSGLRSGIWVGTSSNDMTMVEQEYEHFKEQGTARSYVLSSAYPHAAAKEMGAALQCLGQVTTISIGCSSGLFSIMFAAEAIARGEVDLALAGGGDAPITPFLYSCFCSAGFLSTSFNHNPRQASRPFDSNRDGGVLSEGAGMVVLESAERAARRRAYGYLSGWHTSNACNYNMMGSAFQASITGALQAAKLYPREIDYICANAPGDRFIDAVEVKVVERVFSRHASCVPISSIKSTVGNPLAAAGPLQMIASFQAMKDRYLPPTVNLEQPKPHRGLDFVPGEGRVARVENVLLNAQGLGGSNISFVLKAPGKTSSAGGGRQGTGKTGGEWRWK